MMMAEAQGDDDDDIFVYMGGDQEVPAGVRRARIHKEVKIVRARAFQNRRNLIYIEFHDGVEIIGEEAFGGCWSLKAAIKLQGIKIIKAGAFAGSGLTDVEFGDKLETIEEQAFRSCYSLRKIRISSVRTVGGRAFAGSGLSDVEFGGALRTLQVQAFEGCSKLNRIVLPLKVGMIGDEVFDNCTKLTTIDIAGGIHQTVATLHMESWRCKMTDEINRINNEVLSLNRINQVRPTITTGKRRKRVIRMDRTPGISLWMESVINRLNHYKNEHRKVLKETTMLLELALWKIKLDGYDECEVAKEGVLLARESLKRERKEMRVTSGANVVIKNVLPFLVLK